MSTVADSHRTIYGRRGERYYDVPVGEAYRPRCQRIVVKRGHVHVCEFVAGHSDSHEEVDTWLSPRRFKRLMAFFRLPIRQQAAIWRKVDQGTVVWLDELERIYAAQSREDDNEHRAI